MRDDAGVQQGGAAGASLGEQIRQDVQRAVTEARVQAAQAAQEAAAARQEAAARAAQAAEAGQVAPGTVFRVGPGGEIITVSPGERVTVGRQPGEPTVVIDGTPVNFEPHVPPEVVDIMIAFFVMIAVILIGLPLARAYARRMDRRTPGPDRQSAEQAAQLQHIQTAVDAMAVEVERISENQRFVTRLLAEGGGAEKVAARPLGEMREAR